MMRAMRTGTSRVPDCPIAAPARRTLHARTIHRACVMVGGVAQLAAQLDATEHTVRCWLEGVEEPPEAAFLAAVDILLLAADKERGIAS
jgi:hypothetical protein